MAAEASGLDEARMIDVGRLLGLDGLRVAVRSLAGASADAFRTPGTERGEAHALASQAEMVGFIAFGRACRAVEVAARAGEPLGRHVEAAAAARDEALAAMEAFLAQEGSMEEAATAASERLRTPIALNRLAR